MRHTTFNWNEIEPRIREHVKTLRDAGFETTASCGHGMWISLEIEAAEIPKLCETLRARGYRDFEIAYTIHEGFHRHKGAVVKFGGDLAGDGKPFDLVLLKVQPEAHPLYFVIKSPVWPGIERTDDSDEYYYGEHTCPTNWTDDILAVISDGDADPHGFATFVRRRPAPPEMDENGHQSEDDWTELFPETKSMEVS